MSRVARSVVVLAKAGRGGGGAGAWSPSSLSGSYAPLQWALDGGAAFESTTLDSYQPLRSLESYGTYRKPRAGRCGVFDGTNDYGTLGARLTSGSISALTACGWIKLTSATGFTALAAEYRAGTNDRSWIVAQSAGKLNVIISADGTNTGTTAKDYSSTTTLSAGTWYHVAFTWNAGALKLYINGVEVAVTKTQDPSIATAYSGAAHFGIGAYGLSSNPTGYTASAMRDWRTYNVAKSDAAILAIYNQADAPTTLDTTGLLGGWWLNEEAGTTAYDWSGNGKHLTLTNITTSTFHASDTGVTYNPANFLGRGGGFVFDGTDDYATLSARISSGTQTAFSVAFWLRTSDTNGVICEEWANSPRAWSLYIFSGKLYLTTSADGAAISDAYYNGGTINDGAWRHIVVTYSSGTVAIYFNGVSQTVTGAGAASIYNTTAGFTVGGLVGNGYLAGAVSDLRFYSVAKSAAEAAAIYTGTNDTTGLLGRWNGSRDLSGNGKHLAMMNGAAELVLPRNEAVIAKDTLGSSLPFTGLSPHPAVIETPCLTGDGVTVAADLGSALIPPSADFELSFKLKRLRSDVGDTYLAQSASGDTFVVYAASATAVNLYINGGSLVVGVDCAANQWVSLEVTRVGSDWTFTVTNLETGAVTSGSGTSSYAIQTANTTLLLRNAGNWGASAIITDFRITTGGVTTYFPLQEGPGASSTNRDLHYVKSDGTYGVVSGAIVNGTVANIWANRCPGYAQDWCANYGGRLSTQNSLAYSEQFDNAAWTKTDLAVTANAATSPSGAVTAEKLIPANGISNGSVNQTAGAAAINSAVAFSLVDGSAVVIASTPAYSATDVGEGWWRLSITDDGWTFSIYAKAAGWNYIMLQIFHGVRYIYPYQNSSTSGTGNGTDGVYVWGAQDNAGSSPAAYQPTTSAAIPANVFVPGQISGTLAADGLTKTLTAGKHGNEYSRFSPNPWDAPEMRAIGYTPSTLYAPGDDVQAVSPADTKFRRTAAAGDDRFFAVASALTGSNKTNAEAYVA